MCFSELTLIAGLFFSPAARALPQAAGASTQSAGCAMLAKGARAYKASEYPQASEYFKAALQADPNLVLARIYLAATYTNLFRPGDETEDNLRVGEQAIEEFSKVLEAEPSDADSLGVVAFLYQSLRKNQEARRWYQRQAEAAPQNPAPHYALGALGWVEAYTLRQDNSDETGARLRDEAARQAFCLKAGPILDEALQHLTTAIELGPNDPDAMSYINLVHREKAECEPNPAAAAEHRKRAAEWLTKARAAKRKRAPSPPVRSRAAAAGASAACRGVPRPDLTELISPIPPPPAPPPPPPPPVPGRARPGVVGPPPR